AAGPGRETDEMGGVRAFLDPLAPARPGAEETAAPRRLLDRHGLRCVSMSGHAPLHEEIGRARLRNVLRAGTELGIGVLNTFTGDAETAEERERFVEGARALADEAESVGVRLCIETDSNLLPTAQAGLELLEAG